MPPGLRNKNNFGVMEYWSAAKSQKAFQHFFQSLRSGQHPSVGPEDGVTTVALAMAVYESARTGALVRI